MSCALAKISDYRKSPANRAELRWLLDLVGQKLQLDFIYSGYALYLAQDGRSHE